MQLVGIRLRAKEKVPFSALPSSALFLYLSSSPRPSALSSAWNAASWPPTATMLGWLRGWVGSFIRLVVIGFSQGIRCLAAPAARHAERGSEHVGTWPFRRSTGGRRPRITIAPGGGSDVQDPPSRMGERTDEREEEGGGGTVGRPRCAAAKRPKTGRWFGALSHRVHVAFVTVTVSSMGDIARGRSRATCLLSRA